MKRSNHVIIAVTNFFKVEITDDMNPILEGNIITDQAKRHNIFNYPELYLEPLLDCKEIKTFLEGSENILVSPNGVINIQNQAKPTHDQEAIKQKALLIADKTEKLSHALDILEKAENELEPFTFTISEHIQSYPLNDKDVIFSKGNISTIELIKKEPKTILITLNSGRLKELQGKEAFDFLHLFDRSLFEGASQLLAFFDDTDKVFVEKI